MDHRRVSQFTTAVLELNDGTVKVVAAEDIQFIKEEEDWK